MRKFFLAFTALLAIGIGSAIGNYSATQGVGTDFGSAVVSSVHYAKQLICDLTAPATQCATVKAGNTMAVADVAVAVADPTLLAAVNAPIPAQTTNAVNIGAVMNAGSTYETVAASVTGQILGGAGAVGDYLSHCVIYPTSTTPGVVTVFDDASAAGTNVIAFPGGASSVSNLAPISIPVGAVSVTGEWRVTTGANLVVTCYGKFT